MSELISQRRSGALTDAKFEFARLELLALAAGTTVDRLTVAPSMPPSPYADAVAPSVLPKSAPRLPRSPSTPAKLGVETVDVRSFNRAESATVEHEQARATPAGRPNGPEPWGKTQKLTLTNSSPSFIAYGASLGQQQQLMYDVVQRRNEELFEANRRLVARCTDLANEAATTRLEHEATLKRAGALEAELHGERHGKDLDPASSHASLLDRAIAEAVSTKVESKTDSQREPAESARIVLNDDGAARARRAAAQAARGGAALTTVLERARRAASVEDGDVGGTGAVIGHGENGDDMLASAGEDALVSYETALEVAAELARALKGSVERMQQAFQEAVDGGDEPLVAALSACRVGNTVEEVTAAMSAACRCTIPPSLPELSPFHLLR